MENKETFVKLLNTAFEKEYNDVFLYLKEAELFRKKLVDGEVIGKVFETFSVEELRHADRIAAKLIELGERPEWIFGSLEPSASLREVLKQHLASETKAVRYCEELIDVCDDADFKIILKGIREDEKEHYAKAARILKHLRS